MCHCHSNYINKIHFCCNTKFIFFKYWVRGKFPAGLPLGQCVTKLFSEFRSYRKTKFSTPEIPDFNGTNSVVPNSEKFRENYQNCYRNSGPKPLSEIILEPNPLSKIIPGIPFFSKIPVYYLEPLLRIKNSGLNQMYLGQIHTCQKLPQNHPS